MELIISWKKNPKHYKFVYAYWKDIIANQCIQTVKIKKHPPLTPLFKTLPIQAKIDDKYPHSVFLFVSLLLLLRLQQKKNSQFLNLKNTTSVEMQRQKKKCDTAISIYLRSSNRSNNFFNSAIKSLLNL